MSDRDLSPRAAEMLAIIRDYESTKGDPTEYAKLAGIKLSTFTWWRSRLRRHLDGGVHGFVEVKLAPSVKEPIRVRMAADIAIDVPFGFDASEVRRLVDALREC